MSRLGRRNAQRDRNVTPALRLAEVITTPGGTILDIEVQWCAPISEAAASWRAHEVRVGLHWLDRKGDVVDWDGPRTEPIEFGWLPLTPQRRRLAIGSPPAGARRVAVELVVEGLAWGEAFGLAPLLLPLPGFGDPIPARGARDGIGPKPPEEHPDVTRAWLAAGWPADAQPQEMAN